MKTIKTFALSATITLLTLTACGKQSTPAPVSPPVNASSNAANATASATTATSKLGDLSSFRAILVDVSALLDKGDAAGATARIKDLETTWDSAEAGLKPRDASSWHMIDKTIDTALTAVRATPSDVAASKKTVNDAINIMTQLGGKV